MLVLSQCIEIFEQEMYDISFARQAINDLMTDHMKGETAWIVNKVKKEMDTLATTVLDTLAKSVDPKHIATRVANGLGSIASEIRGKKEREDDSSSDSDNDTTDGTATGNSKRINQKMVDYLHEFCKKYPSYRTNVLDQGLETVERDEYVQPRFDNMDLAMGTIRDAMNAVPKLKTASEFLDQLDKDGVSGQLKSAMVFNTVIDLKKATKVFSNVIARTKATMSSVYREIDLQKQELQQAAQKIEREKDAMNEELTILKKQYNTIANWRRAKGKARNALQTDDESALDLVENRNLLQDAMTESGLTEDDQVQIQEKIKQKHVEMERLRTQLRTAGTNLTEHDEFRRSIDAAFGKTPTKPGKTFLTVNEYLLGPITTPELDRLERGKRNFLDDFVTTLREDETGFFSANNKTINDDREADRKDLLQKIDKL